jgi:hypothetical protein
VERPLGSLHTSGEGEGGHFGPKETPLVASSLAALSFQERGATEGCCAGVAPSLASLGSNRRLLLPSVAALKTP